MQSVCFYLDKYITYIFCQFLSKLATSEQRFKNISTIKKILIKLIITLLFVNKTGSLMIKQKWQQKFIKASNTHFHNDYQKVIQSINLNIELDVALRYITNVFTLPPSFHSAAGHNLTREARDNSYTREFRVLKALEEESLVVHMRMECVQDSLIPIH